MLIILCSIYFKSASPDGFKQEKPFVARLALAASMFPSTLPHSFVFNKKAKGFISINKWQAEGCFWNQICLKDSN